MFWCFADRASHYILIINQLDAQTLFYNKLISCLYMFRAPCVHRQEVKIALYSIWYHHTTDRRTDRQTKGHTRHDEANSRFSQIIEGA